MILFSALGFGVRAWLGWPPGIAVGLIAGLLVAQLVPSQASCRITHRPADDPPS